MIGKIFKFFVAPILLLLLIFVGYSFHLLWKHEMFVEPTYDTVAPTVPDAEGKPLVLVFSKTNGFRHIDAIPAAHEMFADFGKSEGWTVFKTENAAVHNAEDLAKFDLIVWNNVSGDALTSDQQKAFQSHMENGGQFLGIHASGGDREYSWKWQPETLIQTQFRSHPNIPHFQDAKLTVENSAHPATRHLPAIWDQNDEWYTFETSPRDKVTVLVSIDEDSYNPSTWFGGGDLKMGDHPMIWHHKIGEGRVFYSALGHQASSYADENYRTVLREASKWLLDTPKTEASTDTE